jgi:hypothetical protein
VKSDLDLVGKFLAEEKVFQFGEKINFSQPLKQGQGNGV